MDDEPRAPERSSDGQGRGQSLKLPAALFRATGTFTV